MEEWRRLALLLCVYGVLKELRPLEPYITTFLNGPPMNFTHDQINLEIYPLSVYSNLVCLVVIFLVTDLLRYKPIIVLNSAAGLALYVLLLTCRSVFALQVVEVLYGLYIACEVAYYTYIYTKVDKSHYQEVTGYTRAAYLSGRALSGILAQLLLAIGLHLMTIAEITLGIVIISSLWALFLPSVDSSIYFHRENSQHDTNDTTLTNTIRRGFGLLYEDFKTASTQANIYKYVIWWAACNAGYLQLLQFVQVLWIEITDSHSGEDSSYNGIVEAICTFTGAMGAFSFGRWAANWNHHGDLAMGLGALVLGAVLVAMSLTNSMWVAYLTYITFSVVFNAVVTIVKSQIATHIKPDSTGLVFGVTTFLALVLQTTATVLLVQTLQLTAKTQFAIYGYYHLSIGAVYALKWTTTRCRAGSIDVSSGKSEPKNDGIDNRTDIFG